MAQESDSSDGQDVRYFWGAARILALGTLQRLLYNRKRYDQDVIEEQEFAPEILSERTDEIMLDVMAYRNVRSAFSGSGNPAHASASLLLVQRIGNQLYTLHHDLLERDAAELVTIIPILDEELRIWNNDPHSDAPDDTPSASEADSTLKNLYRIQELIESLPGRTY